MKRLIVLSILAVALVIIDQVSKSYVHANFYLGESFGVIDNFFDLTYVRNTGVAWGMGAGSSDLVRIPLFLVLPVLACFWLLYMLWVGRKKDHWRLALVYSLILAGAVGNLIDRFSLKFVIDFFDFYHGTWHFPAFNVADACISVAAGLWIIDYIIQLQKKNVS